MEQRHSNLDHRAHLPVFTSAGSGGEGKHEVYFDVQNGCAKLPGGSVIKNHGFDP